MKKLISCYKRCRSRRTWSRKWNNNIKLRRASYSQKIKSWKCSCFRSKRRSLASTRQELRNNWSRWMSRWKRWRWLLWGCLRMLIWTIKRKMGQKSFKNLLWFKLKTCLKRRLFWIIVVCLLFLGRSWKRRFRVRLLKFRNLTYQIQIPKTQKMHQ